MMLLMKGEKVRKLWVRGKEVRSDKERRRKERKNFRWRMGYI